MCWRSSGVSPKQPAQDRAYALLHAEIAFTLTSEIGSTEALTIANEQLER